MNMCFISGIVPPVLGVLLVITPIATPFAAQTNSSAVKFSSPARTVSGVTCGATSGSRNFTHTSSSTDKTLILPAVPRYYKVQNRTYIWKPDANNVWRWELRANNISDFKLDVAAINWGVGISQFTGWALGAYADAWEYENGITKKVATDLWSGYCYLQP